MTRRKRKIVAQTAFPANTQFNERPGLELELCRNLLANVKLLHGPLLPEISNGGLTVLCLVRNGELYIRSFIEHYRKFGVSHFVFLDNGSTDRTIKLIREYRNTTILQTDLDFRIYFSAADQFLFEMYGREKWCLVVDIDELFDFPLSRAIGWPGLRRYLTENKFTAMSAHLLDMFSEVPLAHVQNTIGDSLMEKFPYYDLSQVVQVKMDKIDEENDTSAGKVERYFGGIRRKVFGLEDVFLTKHPLIYGDSHGCWYGNHLVRGARIADISGVIFHFKFVSTFTEYVKESVMRENHWNASAEYKAYDKALKANPALTLKTETAKKFTTVEDLVVQEFLRVSKAYLDFVRAFAKGRRT